jgi:hypothetical protein
MHRLAHTQTYIHRLAYTNTDTHISGYIDTYAVNKTLTLIKTYITLVLCERFDTHIKIH